MKYILILISVIVVAGGAYAAKNHFGGTSTTPTPTSVAQASAFTLAVTNPQVFLKSSAQSASQQIQGSVTVSEGANIKTSATGRASLLYPNGTITGIDTNSEFTIAVGGNQGDISSIRLTGGGLFSKIKSILGIEDSYEVRTDNVVASVRGTIFATQFKNHISTIFGLQHQVMVTVLDKNSNPIVGTQSQVGSGFKAIVGANNNTVIVSPMTVEDFKNPLIIFTLQSLTSEERNDPEIKLLLNRAKVPTASPTSKPKASVEPTPTPTVTPAFTPTPTPTSDPAVTLDSVFPGSVSGGTEFTINGSNFMVGRNTKQVTEVFLNATSVIFSITDAQTIFATAQVQSGIYDVSIVTTTDQKLTLKGALTVK